MTDRYDGFAVILKKDIREDDAEQTISAIRQIKGVLSVEPHITDIATTIAESRVKNELWEKVMNVFREE